MNNEELYGITSFNGKLLEVGDKVIVVYGTQLRNKTITDILPYKRGYLVGRIVVDKIKKPIHSFDIVKI